MQIINCFKLKIKIMKRTILLTAIALLISAGITAQNSNQTQNQNQTQTQGANWYPDSNTIAEWYPDAESDTITDW